MPVQSTSIEVESGNALTFSSTQAWSIDQGVLLLSEFGSGVFSQFDNSFLSNYGAITSEKSVAVAMTGANCYIGNSWQGEIKGVQAILLGPNGTVVNAGAIISTGGGAAMAKAAPAATGIAIDAASGGLSLANTGDVIGSVVSRQKAADTVNNAGTILGDVRLGQGADRYDGRGGVVQGEVNGGKGHDTLIGGAGEDWLTGGLGNDEVRGGGGDDVLVGCYGKDVLTGGSGGDAFIFRNAREIDRITDFSVAEDAIHLDGAAFAGLGRPGALRAEAFHVGRQAADDEDRVIYNARTGIVKIDRNGDDPGGAVKVAVLDAGLALAHHHFEIV